MQDLTGLVTLFDVEGTLIDCVPQTLRCWQRTLADAGHRVEVQQLQSYSGMDGGEMLDCLLPDLPKDRKKALLDEQGENYRRLYMPSARPCIDVRRLFTDLKEAGVIIAIVTTCQRDELATYDSMMHAIDLADAVTCGAEVKRGKPDPALFRATLKKLGSPDPEKTIAIGDTPYDAKAAKSAGIRSVGVLTGGYSQADLHTAGCSCVIRSLAELGMRLEGMQVNSASRTPSSLSV